MWQDDAHSIAHHYHRITDRHGPRLLLGIGLGHPESRGSYEKPYERMVHYADTLLQDGVPSDAVVMGALRGQNPEARRRTNPGRTPLPRRSSAHPLRP